MLWPSFYVEYIVVIQYCICIAKQFISFGSVCCALLSSTSFFLLFSYFVYFTCSRATRMCGTFALFATSNLQVLGWTLGTKNLHNHQNRNDGKREKNSTSETVEFEFSIIWSFFFFFKPLCSNKISVWFFVSRLTLPLFLVLFYLFFASILKFVFYSVGICFRSFTYFTLAHTKLCSRHSAPFK